MSTRLKEYYRDNICLITVCVPFSVLDIASGGIPAFAILSTILLTCLFFKK